jgi:hypothetical protein
LAKQSAKKVDAVKVFLGQLDWKVLREEFEELVSGGQTPRQAAQAVARAVDAAIPWDELIDGPTGELAEAIDGPVIRVAVTLVLVLTNRGK